MMHVFQASGVKVDPSCKNAYEELHSKHKHAYIIFKVRRGSGWISERKSRVKVR